MYVFEVAYDRRTVLQKKKKNALANTDVYSYWSHAYVELNIHKRLFSSLFSPFPLLLIPFCLRETMTVFDLEFRSGYKADHGSFWVDVVDGCRGDM